MDAGHADHQAPAEGMCCSPALVRVPTRIATRYGNNNGDDATLEDECRAAMLAWLGHTLLVRACTKEQSHGAHAVTAGKLRQSSLQVAAKRVVANMQSALRRLQAGLNANKENQGVPQTIWVHAAQFRRCKFLQDNPKAPENQQTIDDITALVAVLTGEDEKKKKIRM